MGLFGNIGKKNVDKVVGGLISGADKLFFTNEEKAEFNKQMADAVAEYAKATLNESTVRSMTRRFIAFAVMGTYLGLFIVTAVAYFVMPEVADKTFALSKELGTMAIMVAVFYFGGYYANKFIGSEKKKKNES